MLLDRRQFLEGIPALSPSSLLAAADPGAKTRFYVLEQFYLENGGQPVRIHDFLA